MGLRKTSKRSPLKNKPLRNPGQSLDDRIIDLAFDAMFYMMVALVFSMMAMMEWIQHLSDSPPSPYIISLMAVVAIIVAFYKVRPIKKKMKNYKLGRDGEKAVGQLLDRLRQPNVRVFHDICSEKFNIDHVYISEKGVFVVETKTWSKQESGKSVIDFDGDTLKKNGYVVQPSPALQAVACSRYLSDLLFEATEKRFAVQPIVTFPGWWVNQSVPYFHGKPWVLNPEQIPPFFNNAKVLLPKDDVLLASSHLAKHIRSS